MSKWTEAETELLCKLYPMKPAKKLEGLFKRSAGAIRLKAIQCGIRRDFTVEWEAPYDINTLSPFDIGWTAGMVDGDGTLDLDGPSLMIRVGNTSKEVTEKLHRLWGGSVRLGHTPKGKPFWRWKLSTHGSFSLLQLLLPFLTAKREQAEICIEYRSLVKARTYNQWTDPYTPTEKNQMQEFRARLKSLKARGQG